MARKRFNRNAICRVDGNSGIYEASHKSHRDALREAHKNVLLMVETNTSKVEVILDDSEITVTLWGKPVKIQYRIAKAAGLIK